MLPDIKIADEVVRVVGHRHALVASHTFPGEWHVVDQDDEGVWACTCKGAEIRKKCRHIDAVREWALGRIHADIIDPNLRDEFAAGPTLDEALHDPALYEKHIVPFIA